MRLKTKLGLFALAIALATPSLKAHAQEIGSLYFTPKIFYSYQKGDTSGGAWQDGAWNAPVMGGSGDDSNVALGLAIGTDLGYYYDLPMRLEFEYMYRTEANFGGGSATVNGGAGERLSTSQNFDVKAHTFMVNGFYDINLDTFFTPYIGGGIGLGYLSTNYALAASNNNTIVHNSRSGDDWNFVWNVGGGVAFPLSENISLDFGYRYVDLGTGSVGNVSVTPAGGYTYHGNPEVDYTTHEFGVGLRFSGF